MLYHCYFWYVYPFIKKKKKRRKKELQDVISSAIKITFSIYFQKIAEMAHAHDALLLVDNSIMSPVLSQPLELGAGSKINLEL